MSALSTGTTEEKDSDKQTFHFEQKVPVPSYLIAFAIGDLVSKEIGTIMNISV
jgi:leukotriene-A4 hydrolase